MSLRFDIITIFPEFFDGPFRFGVLKRALDTGKAEVAMHDLRQWTEDKHRSVDDRPFGGGEGMVLKPEPLFAAVESLRIAPRAERDTRRESVVLLSAQGRRFTQAMAHELAGAERVVLLCGRYEGVDERVNELLADREISVGDFVLSGGELAAALIVDTVARLLPGVLGNDASSHHESFGVTGEHSSTEAAGASPVAVHGAGGLLDYPQYTRPSEFRGAAVPEVLVGGDHREIRRWRREKALEKTLRNRPDLLEFAELSAQDRRYLEQLKQQISPENV
jgi:tRNA (guanine37-N1)-methyltransferase